YEKQYLQNKLEKLNYQLKMDVYKDKKVRQFEEKFKQLKCQCMIQSQIIKSLTQQLHFIQSTQLQSNMKHVAEHYNLTVQDLIKAITDYKTNNILFKTYKIEDNEQLQQDNVLNQLSVNIENLQLEDSDDMELENSFLML